MLPNVLNLVVSIHLQMLQLMKTQIKRIAVVVAVEVVVAVPEEIQKIQKIIKRKEDTDVEQDAIEYSESKVPKGKFPYYGRKKFLYQDL